MQVQREMPVARLAARLLDVQFLRYFIASAGALAVDMGIFLVLLPITLPAAASALGYCVGIVAHWLLSSRSVFGKGLQERGAGRTRQKALFVVSALAGLAATTAIVGLGDWLGSDPRFAKLMAVAASFCLTYVLRSRVVFRVTAA